MRTATLLVTLGLALLAPAIAHADPKPDAKTDIPAKARALAERGRAHHDAGDYAAAIAAFTEAYALAPSPALLFNLAQSYRLAGHCDDASTMYNRFLATDPPPEARALAETNLIAVDQCVAALRPVALPPAPVSVIVTPKPPELSPAEQHAAVEHDAGVGLVGGGAIALVGSLVYEMRAHSASQTVSQTYEHGGAGSTIAATDAQGRHDADLADAFGITGIVALGAGATLLWMGAHEGHAHHVAVMPASRGAQIQAAWRF